MSRQGSEGATRPWVGLWQYGTVLWTNHVLGSLPSEDVQQLRPALEAPTNSQREHEMCLHPNPTPQTAEQLVQHPGCSITLFLPPVLENKRI